MWSLSLIIITSIIVLLSGALVVGTIIGCHYEYTEVNRFLNGELKNWSKEDAERFVDHCENELRYIEGDTRMKYLACKKMLKKK